MLDFLNDMAKGIGKVVGATAGVVLGVPLQVIATTLGMSITMVKEAMDAGCETYDEIKKFHNME